MIGRHVCPFDGEKMSIAKCRDCVEFDHARGTVVACFAAQQFNRFKQSAKTAFAVFQKERLFCECVAREEMDERTPLDDCAQTERREMVASAVGTLTDFEISVIVWRFVGDLTLEECAKRRGCTRTRIAQVESKALRKLRHPYRLKKLPEP